MSRRALLAAALDYVGFRLPEGQGGRHPKDDERAVEDLLAALRERGLAIVVDAEAFLAGQVWTVETYRIGMWDIPVPDLLHITGTARDEAYDVSAPEVPDDQQARILLLRFLGRHLPPEVLSDEVVRSIRDVLSWSDDEPAPPAPPTVSPGQVIHQYMHDASMRPEDFALACGWSDGGLFVERLIRGEEPVTPEVAAHLAQATGIPSFLWMLLQGAA